MSHRIAVVLTVLLLTVALLAVVPATAAEAPVGTQVNLIGGTPTELSAGTPFHVLHGWGLDPGEARAIGIWDFSLEIDGVDQGKGSMQQSVTNGDGLFMARLKLFNFEDGLPAGTYMLTGFWTGPCQQLVDAFFIPGPCDKPNESEVGFTWSLELTVNG